MTIIANLYFSIVVLSLIVLVDVLVKFKKPFALKVFFLFVPISIGLYALINATSAICFVFFIATLKTYMAVCVLNIFSILYFPKFKKLVLVGTLSMLAFTIFLMFVNKGIFPRNSFIDSFRVISVDENLNVEISPLIRFIRFSFLFFVALNIGYFWYVIYKKLNLNNIYYEKLKNWTSLIFILTCIVIIMNVIISFTNKPELLVNSLSVFIAFYILLLVLKRPSFLNHYANKIAFGQKFNLDDNVQIETHFFQEEFFNNRYYTNSDASLDNLSKLLKVNAGELSNFVQIEYQLTFNELVNKNRVAYFLNIVQNAAFQNFTIDALAKQVGFSSRQHLNKPFKKFHGGNPSELIDAFNGA